MRHQLPTILTGMFFGVLWMLSWAMVPFTLGKAIDAGLTARDTGGLLVWTGAFLGLSTVQTVAATFRHRNAVSNWLQGSFRTAQVVVAHSGRLGATLSKRLASGEVVAIGASDTNQIGSSLDVTARLAGSLVTLAVVTIILLDASFSLGLVVLLGVPVALGVVALLIRPLHHRQQAYREQQGKLTGRAIDIVAGLRVLRGIGGESVFAGRYRAESQQLRHLGVRAAGIDSLLAAAEILAPGLLVVLVTWLGARYALAGEITVGQLVSFYGYAAFLVVPLRTCGEALEKFTRAHVSAGRVLRVLRLRPEIADPADPVELPAHPAPLHDARSGLTVQPGVVTAIAPANPDDAIALVERLGRYIDSEVTLGGVPLRAATTAQVRERILVSDNSAQLFTGPLREVLAPDACSAARLRAAMVTASAEDILDAMPDGWETYIAERGRELSGGQQQRVRLARALLADPPTLILVEPTSAVDAHTEARIAARLGEYRRGRTTVIVTTSPLVLDRADRVAYLEDGKVLGTGTHKELLAGEPRYRAVVERGEG